VYFVFVAIPDDGVNMIVCGDSYGYVPLYEKLPATAGDIWMEDCAVASFTKLLNVIEIC
jgi:hypothetical protein